VIARYTDLGPNALEVVIEGEVTRLDINVLSSQESSPMESLNVPTVWTDPPPEQLTSVLTTTEDAVCAAVSPPRLAPAASSGFKAGLASFGGMIAAALLYVQQNFGSVTDISIKNVLLVAVGAIISGLLYFLYRYYKPHT